MIRTVITPEKQDIFIHVPENYVGKKIEVLMYDIDELEPDEAKSKKKASEFRGKLNLSDEQYKDIQSHLKDIRNEWEKGYLIDTNAIIDYLENKLPEKTSEIVDSNTVNISVVSRIELLAWPKATEDQLNVLTGFINASQVLLLSEDIIVKTIEIRKKFKIKLPDPIIAATALVNNFSLLSRNISDFKKVDGLTVTDPYLL